MDKLLGADGGWPTTKESKGDETAKLHDGPSVHDMGQVGMCYEHWAHSSLAYGLSNWQWTIRYFS